jgi:hypothetical protein
MAQNVIFDTCEAKCAGHVEAGGLEIARDQLHRGDPAFADAADELLPVGEGGPWAPEPQSDRISEVVDDRGAGG